MFKNYKRKIWLGEWVRIRHRDSVNLRLPWYYVEKISFPDHLRINRIHEKTCLKTFHKKNLFHQAPIGYRLKFQIFALICIKPVVSYRLSRIIAPCMRHILEKFEKKLKRPSWAILVETTDSLKYIIITILDSWR